MAIIIGNSDYLGNASGGWNAAGNIWGNTANNQFTFATQANITEVTGNSSWKFYGLGGNDTIDFGTSTAGVTFNLGQIISNDNTTYTANGSNFSDTFQWTGAFGNIGSIVGGDGNDTLTATLATGPVSIDVNDTRISGFETFVGGASNDSFYWNGTGTLTAVGGGGNDTFFANSAGSSDGIFNFANATLTNIGKIGHNGTANATYIFGSTTFTQTIEGSAANDFVQFNTATGLTINVNDAKYGTSIDKFIGGAGNDTFTWNAIGAVTVDGGSGTSDVLTVSAATSAVTINLNDSVKINHIESFIGTSLDDTFNWSGSVGMVSLNGGNGTDTLNLYNGEAVTNGKQYNMANISLTNVEMIAGTDAANEAVNWNGLGSFSFDLGNGTDTLNLASATSGKEINLYDARFKNIEVVNGTNFADTLRGTTAAESLNGGNGADILYGGEDTINDTLVGGNGADTYYWARGYGNDIIADGGATSVVDTLVLTDVALADLNIGSTINAHTIGTNAVTYDGANIAFNLFKDGGESQLTMDLANDSAMHRQIVLTDATFNLFYGNQSSTISGTSTADLIYTYNSGGTILDGKAGADTLVGGAGNDTFVYGSTDMLFGGLSAVNGNDVVTAAASTTAVEINLNDTAHFNSIERVIGSSLADTLRGSDADNTLEGGVGADILYGGKGADSMKGGAGADTFWFASGEGNDTIGVETPKTDSAQDVVRLSGISFGDLSFGLVNGNDAFITFKDTTGLTGNLTVEKFAEVNTTYGASNANLYRVNTFIADDKTFGLALGTTATSVLGGSSLDDYIVGAAYTTAAQTIDGGLGVDTIYGSSANDYVKFDSLDAYVNGAGGNDTLAMSAAGTMDVRSSDVYNGFTFLKGSTGADIIRGGSAAETIEGGAGADNLWGYTGNDSLVGGAGADTYWFTSGDGSDSIGNDSVNNKLDVVRFSGLSFNDLSFGVAVGSDLTIAVGGTDSLTLTNWASYADATAAKAATANLYRVNTFVTDDKTFGLAIGNDTATSLLGTSMDDYILGGLANDTLKGGAGVDSLYGGAGNDFLFYSAEDAVFNGGNDVDTLSAAASTAAVEINLYDSKISNIEYLQGSTLGDILRGSDASGETLDGGKGTDHLYGGKGDDFLMGGAGADTYWFGTQDGADTISSDTVNNGSDVVNFYNVTMDKLTFTRINSDADLKISVDAAGGYTDNLVLQGWGTDAVAAKRVSTFVTSDATFGLAIGTSNPETLTGTSLKDYIFAGDGADSINGGLGADTILAGAGDDTVVYFATAASIDGGDGTDVLTAAASSTAVEIDLRNVDSTKTQITNIESVIGSSKDDILRGSSLNETLNGGAGNDNLWGAEGADVLTGGAGVDTYWFGVTDGADTISASTANNLDYVKFYGGIDGNSIQSTVVSGDNLTITLTSGDALTLTDWNKTDGSKLNNFDFGAAGVWGLSVASDGTTATWTRRNS